MQSAVKKCSTTYTWGFAIPIPLSCIPFLLAADFKSADSQSLVLSEGDTESISPSEAACGMAQESKRLRVYTIVDFSFIRTFAPSF